MRTTYIRLCNFDYIFKSRDNHPPDHISFASNNGKDPFTKIIIKETGLDQMMWPDHCIQGTGGNKYVEGLKHEDRDIEVFKG